MKVSIPLVASVVVMVASLAQAQEAVDAEAHVISAEAARAAGPVQAGVSVKAAAGVPDEKTWDTPEGENPGELQRIDGWEAGRAGPDGKSATTAGPTLPAIWQE